MPQDGNVYITIDNTFVKLTGVDTVKFYQNGTPNPLNPRDIWELQMSVNELNNINTYIQNQLIQNQEIAVTEPETTPDTVTIVTPAEVAVTLAAASTLSGEDVIEGGDAGGEVAPVAEPDATESTPEPISADVIPVEEVAQTPEVPEIVTPANE